MSNVKPVTNCPRCKNTGNVVKHSKRTVHLECPRCREKWSTLSEICPDCHNPNGFFVKGPCSKCYSERHKIS